jgi:hypothetical protein
MTKSQTSGGAVPRLEHTDIDIADLSLADPAGGRLSAATLTGVHILVLMRHRHWLPCQQHLVQVQQLTHDRRIGLILVGFSPPWRLSPIARHLGWKGTILGDEERELYRRLGLGRAHWWRVYSPGTLAMYVRHPHKVTSRPIAGEDTRQLGGDAIVKDGHVVRLWRPRTPNDRPPAAEVLAAANGVLAEILDSPSWLGYPPSHDGTELTTSCRLRHTERVQLDRSSAGIRHVVPPPAAEFTAALPDRRGMVADPKAEHRQR